MLKLINICKQYSGIKVLKNIHLNVEKKTIHGLLGENGAGKSTSMKIISGSLLPNEGTIEYEGKQVKLNSVLHAQSLGISIVYQELSLFNNLTVAQNIFVMNEITNKIGIINDKAIEQKTQEFLDSLNIKLDAKAMVSDLSVSQMQLVEIAKVVKRKPKLIILDEPTSSLGKDEANILFNIIKDLKSKNTSFIYISHKMDEIFEICDKITILKDGENVKTLNIKEANYDQVVNLMIGRDIKDTYPKRNKKPQEEIILSCQDISFPPYYKNVSFKIKKGEVVGFYGLVGSGRTEIAKGIFGLLPAKSGKIFISEKEIKINSPAKAIENNIALISENRKEEGLILDFSIENNISMVEINNILKGLFINGKKEEDLSKKFIKKLNIKASSIYQIANNLSGGNQQKVVLSKWFTIDSNLIILDEPTRGIDIGAKFEIYNIINELVESGISILLISSEITEVLNLSDRIYLCKGNTLISEHKVKELSENKIMDILLKS